MALPVLHAFTAADNANINTVLSEWSLVGPGQVGISANAFYPSGSVEGGARLNTESPANDQYAQFEVAAIAATNFGYVGAGVRMASGAHSYYGFYGYTGNSQFFKEVAGTWTQFGSDLTAFAVGDVVRVEVVGTTVRAFRNGVQVASATDSSLTSGQVGVVIACTASTTASRGDNFQGGNVSVAKSAPTFVGAGTVDFTATSDEALTPGLPSGWQADDIHVLVIGTSSNVDIPTPSGWTPVLPAGSSNGAVGAENNTTALRVEVFWRRAVGGDSGPSVAAITSTAVRVAKIFGVRGCPTVGAPFSGYTRSNNASSATVTWLTNSVSDDDVFALAVYVYEDDPTAASTPTNWAAPVVETSSLGNDQAIGYTTRTYTAAGALGTLTTTVSGGTFANSPSVGILLAFQPAETSVVNGTMVGEAMTADASGPASTFAAGATMVGVAMEATPSMPAAALLNIARLVAAAMEATPSSPASVFSAGATLVGAAMEATPSSPAGTLHGGATLVALVMEASPSSPAGVFAGGATLVGAAMAATASSPAAVLTNLQFLIAAAMEASASAPAGTLHGGAALVGVAMTADAASVAASFLAGAVLVAAAMEASAQAPAGTLTVSGNAFLVAAAMSADASSPAGAFLAGARLVGALMEASASSPAGVLGGGQVVLAAAMTADAGSPAGVFSAGAVLAAVAMLADASMPAGALVLGGTNGVLVAVALTADAASPASMMLAGAVLVGAAMSASPSSPAGVFGAGAGMVGALMEASAQSPVGSLRGGALLVALPLTAAAESPAGVLGVQVQFAGVAMTAMGLLVPATAFSGGATLMALPMTALAQLLPAERDVAEGVLGATGGGRVVLVYSGRTRVVLVQSGRTTVRPWGG